MQGSVIMAVLVSPIDNIESLGSAGVSLARFGTNGLSPQGDAIRLESSIITEKRKPSRLFFNQNFVRRLLDRQAKACIANAPE
jgi:hypothetical protein